MLLREVIAQNPFKTKETGRIWARVGEIITGALQDENFEVDARRCRERTMLLLDYYKKQDFPSLRRYKSQLLSLIEAVQCNCVHWVFEGGSSPSYHTCFLYVLILTLMIWLKA